jgi:hypothetical protein
MKPHHEIILFTSVVVVLLYFRIFISSSMIGQDAAGQFLFCYEGDGQVVNPPLQNDQNSDKQAQVENQAEVQAETKPNLSFQRFIKSAQQQQQQQ